jgi:hypothetical protein
MDVMNQKLNYTGQIEMMEVDELKLDIHRRPRQKSAARLELTMAGSTVVLDR